MKHPIKFLLILAFILGGCSGDSGFDMKTVDIPTIDNIEFTRSEEACNVNINDFNLSLINTIAENANNIENQQGNILISPLSLSYTLAMRANAGDKNMEKAVCDLLSQDDLQSINTTYNKLLRFLMSDTNGGKLAMANSVWVNEFLFPDPAFISILNDMFYADFYSANLADKKSADKINSWCSYKTGGAIKKISVDICDELQMCILNALAYEGEWKYEFDPTTSSPGSPFYGRDGKSSITTMSQELYSSPNYENEDFVSTIFPFKGRTNMIFILPQEGKSVYEVAERLNPSSLRAIKEDYKEESTLLRIPKFKFSSEDCDLSNLLKTIGVPDNFVPILAGIGTNMDIITRQSNSIDVYEKGAKAASVTLDEPIGILAPRIERLIDINRPFIFMIENSFTGTILLTGIVNNL